MIRWLNLWVPFFVLVVLISGLMALGHRLNAIDRQLHNTWTCIPVSPNSPSSTPRS